MIWWYILSVIWTFGYTALILYIRKIWINLPESPQFDLFQNLPYISVVIAARNEENNIRNCIKSILENDYPKENYEIIIVNDHSTDLTIDVIGQIEISNVRILHQDTNKSGKKAAITKGIEHSQGTLIVLTDADCIAGNKWLSTLSAVFNDQQTNLITGPVLPHSDGTLLQKFQYLDFASVMGVTAFGLSTKLFGLANGANLAFRKEYFFELGGYDGNEHIASGDDIFLMEKALFNNPFSVTFLKSENAIIYTKPESTWNKFINQRKRWAGKTKSYSNNKISILQAYVFILCLLIVCNFGLIFYNPVYGILLIGIMLIVKLLTDYLYLKNMVDYFGKPGNLKGFIFTFVIYFGHILMSGFYALFPQSYFWKDRKIK